MKPVRVIPTEFECEGEVLKGDFVVPPDSGPFPGICKFHGLPGSSDQVSGISTRLAESGYLVLTFDFRGFRRSSGFFRLANQIKDADAAVTHLLQSELTLDDWVGVYGASYGGAIAVLAAVRDPRINAVGIRAPVYDTLSFARSPLIAPAVQSLFETKPPVMHGLDNPDTRKELLDRMISDAEKFNPIYEVAEIAPRPLLITTGDADKGIDVNGVRELYNLAGEPKEFVSVEGANHDLSDPRSYEETVKIVISWFQGVKPI
ncbi:MAG: alpha/beta hydrolase family protein [Candidatus Thorarchaeota archaeon]|jgi:dipeptidyl aminopeptidase/acylaminoacyl peptidase